MTQQSQIMGGLLLIEWIGARTKLVDYSGHKDHLFSKRQS